MKKAILLFLLFISFGIDVEANALYVQEDCDRFAQEAVEYENEILGFETYREVVDAYIAWYELCDAGV